jgi:hypothetical protein
MPCQKHRATTTHEDLLTPPPGALVSPMESYRLARNYELNPLE